MAVFPSLTPTSRKFAPGVYPQREYRALCGAVVKRTFGNKPYGAKLELEYQNVPDSTAVTLINHYQLQTSTNSRFTLSTNVTAGMSGSLATLASASADNLRWEYAGPPEVSSVRPGFSTVRITLNGEIRNPQLDM
jgi:hypothetical protein